MRTMLCYSGKNVYTRNIVYLKMITFAEVSLQTWRSPDVGKFIIIAVYYTIYICEFLFLFIHLPNPHSTFILYVQCSYITLSWIQTPDIILHTLPTFTYIIKVDRFKTNLNFKVKKYRWMMEIIFAKLHRPVQAISQEVKNKEYHT